jgi:acyl carrier protein
MTAGSITARLAELIGEVCDVSPAIIDGHSRLLGFGLDSVRITELIVLIENDFGVALRIQDVTGVQTVEDLARRVERVAGRASADRDARLQRTGEQ